MWCRIDISSPSSFPSSDLSSRLNLSHQEGEKWIVNLIRDPSSALFSLSSDAKIDLEQNVISTNKGSLPVYQSVIEKTRGLAFRTQVLGAAMAKRGSGLPDQPENGEGGHQGQQGQQGGGGHHHHQHQNRRGQPNGAGKAVVAEV